MTQNTDTDGIDRPIDNYPRVVAAGRFILYSGIVQLVVGAYFIYEAWQGIQPGLSALFAFMMGMMFSINLLEGS